MIEREFSASHITKRYCVPNGSILQRSQTSPNSAFWPLVAILSQELPPRRVVLPVDSGVASNLGENRHKIGLFAGQRGVSSGMLPLLIQTTIIV